MASPALVGKGERRLLPQEANGPLPTSRRRRDGPSLAGKAAPAAAHQTPRTTLLAFLLSSHSRQQPRKAATRHNTYRLAELLLEQGMVKW